MALKPLGDRVIVKADEAEAQTASGLCLATEAKEKPQTGFGLGDPDDTGHSGSFGLDAHGGSKKRPAVKTADADADDIHASYLQRKL